MVKMSSSWVEPFNGKGFTLRVSDQSGCASSSLLMQSPTVVAIEPGLNAVRGWKFGRNDRGIERRAQAPASRQDIVRVALLHAGHSRGEDSAGHVFVRNPLGAVIADAHPVMVRGSDRALWPRSGDLSGSTELRYEESKRTNLAQQLPWQRESVRLNRSSRPTCRLHHGGVSGSVKAEQGGSDVLRRMIEEDDHDPCA